jgi:TPR repeat protein
MRTHISFSVVAITLSLVVACVDHRPGSVDVLKYQSGESNQLPSADRASPEDQYQLGMRHEKGNAMPQSYSEPVRWYRLSAMQGNSEAQYKLCELSERGQGLPQDYQEALRWCGLAADQGHGGAMFMLSRLYHTAHGDGQDFVRAHMWYNLAAAHGYNNGKKWRDRLADDMSPSQIAEAQKLAREWSVRMSARQS